MLTDLTKSDTPYVNTVMSAQRRYVKENPQHVEKFLKGIVDGLAVMANPANEKAVKNVLAKRLKLTTPESVQVLYDATVQMHAKTKVPNASVGRHAKHDRCAAPGKSALRQGQGSGSDR